MSEKREIPKGKWEVEQLVTAEEIDAFPWVCDKPCFKITGPESIEGFIWGWYTPWQALYKFCRDLGWYVQRDTQTIYYT